MTHPLAIEVRRLGDAARRHKQMAQQHRRAAQAARRRQAEILVKCRDLGIDVTIIDEGGIHGRPKNETAPDA